MDKSRTYQILLDELPYLLSKEDKEISSFANFAAILMEKFKYHWIGFYLVDFKKNELYLGPFQGPSACTKIQYGKGVCGTAWANADTIRVANVHNFEGHIACSSQSNSEIVVPIKKNGNVVAVLDLDSVEFAEFDKNEQVNLEKCVKILEATIA